MSKREMILYKNAGVLYPVWSMGEAGLGGWRGEIPFFVRIGRLVGDRVVGVMGVGCMYRWL